MLRDEKKPRNSASETEADVNELISMAYKTLGFKEEDIPKEKTVSAEKEASLIPQIPPAELIVEKQAIAEGSFGSIHKGTWGKLQIAVKRVTPTENNEPDDLAPLPKNFAYTIEKNAFAKIADSDDEKNKQYIVRLYGCIEASLEFVLEYAPLGSLDVFIDDNPPADWEICRIILLDVAKAICFLAKIGVLHSDIKSPNVLLFTGMRAKLCDFGLATTEDLDKLPMSGTPEYMAPEIIRGGVHTLEAEIFSYAQLVSELSTWEAPFYDVPDDRFAKSQIYHNIRHGLFASTPKDTPVCLQEIIDNGRKPDPADRPTIETIIEKLAASEPLETSTPRVRLSQST